MAMPSVQQLSPESLEIVITLFVLVVCSIYAWSCALPVVQALPARDAAPVVPVLRVVGILDILKASLEVASRFAWLLLSRAGRAVQSIPLQLFNIILFASWLVCQVPVLLVCCYEFLLPIWIILLTVICQAGSIVQEWILDLCDACVGGSIGRMLQLMVDTVHAEQEDVVDAKDKSCNSNVADSNMEAHTKVPCPSGFFTCLLGWDLFKITPPPLTTLPMASKPPAVRELSSLEEAWQQQQREERWRQQQLKEDMAQLRRTREMQARQPANLLKVGSRRRNLDDFFKDILAPPLDTYEHPKQHTNRLHAVPTPPAPTPLPATMTFTTLPPSGVAPRPPTPHTSSPAPPAPSPPRPSRKDCNIHLRPTQLTVAPKRHCQFSQLQQPCAGSDSGGGARTSNQSTKRRLEDSCDTAVADVSGALKSRRGVVRQ